jgi:hypothetical protein
MGWVFRGREAAEGLAERGVALTVGDAGQPLRASWGSQGMIAFAPQNVVALQLMPDAGGTAQSLTRFEKGQASQRWPEFLPGGKAILFAAGANALSFNNAQVAVQSLVTGKRRNLIQGTYPRYAPSGHLVYGQRGSLMAVSFDLQRLGATGRQNGPITRISPCPDVHTYM